MQSVGLKYDLPKRVLALMLIAIIVATFAAAVKLNEAMILIVPLAVVLLAAYLKSPELGFSAVIVGQNLFAIALSAANFDRPIFAYAPIGIVSLFSIGLLALQKKAAIPKKVNLVIVSVFLVTLIILFNFHRTRFPDYTAVKTVTFLVSCLVPFLCFSSIKSDADFIKKILKGAVVIGTVTILYSALNIVITGDISGWGRFNAIELVNVNHYARNIGFIVVFATWWLFDTERKWLKFGLIVFILSSLSLIIMTGSRTSLLAVMGAVLMYVAFFADVGIKQRISTLVSFVLVIAIPMTLGFGSMMRRFSSLQYVDLAVAGRVGMWLAAWEHKFDRILFGFGTGNFAAILPAWAVGANLRHPHNLFIEYYFEWGIIGLFALAMLFISPILLWRKIRRSACDYAWKSIADLLIVLVAFSFVNGMIDSSAADPHLFTTLGLLVAIYVNSHEGHPA
ncbi:MAG TPA: O-antigen ligase family protein [candidate division Zixibacteria bacterium]|nr:O-antigen ligase family protein [candidate division Zixibacteria bacterium]